MFKSDVFPFKFENYHSEDISVFFENVVFTQNFGPFKEGDKHESVEFNLLDGEITFCEPVEDEDGDYVDDLITKVKTKLTVEN